MVRTHHILLCVILGATYGASIGFAIQLPLTVIAVDSILCMALFYIEAILLWSVFTFGRTDMLNFFQEVCIHIVYSLLSIVIIVAIEYIAVFMLYDDLKIGFFFSIPVRIFVLAVIYVAFRRYYLSSKPDDSVETMEKECEEDILPKEQSEEMERISVKTGNKIKVIPVTDILFLKAEDDYVCVFTAEGHWLKKARLKDFELSLPTEKFARIHRSYIVNIDMITKIERYGQKQLLFMNNGEQIRISSTGYKVLKTKLNL